jgi:hypothetical protein
MTTPAERLLDKLRTFALRLDEAEREVLDVLLAPAVALATNEVDAFAMLPGEHLELSADLAAAIRTAGLFIDPGP